MSSDTPSPGEAAFERALYYERNGRSDAALAAYLQAMEEAPDNLEIAYRTATALLRAGHLDEAVSQLRRIVFVAPDNIPARANLGNCQYLQGDLANAEANFREVLDLDPDNRNALYGLASVLLEQEDAEATRLTEKLVALLPQSAPARTLLARAQSRDPQGAAAIASYRKALEIDPAHMPALLGLARLYMRRKRFGEAAVLASQAHGQDPKATAPLTILADARFANGDMDGAREAMQKALDQSGPEERASLLLQLSGILRKAGELNEALTAVHDAYLLAPSDPHVLNGFGACLASLKLGALARAVLTAASRGTPLEDRQQAEIARIADRLRQQSTRTLPLDDTPSSSEDLGPSGFDEEDQQMPAPETGPNADADPEQEAVSETDANAPDKIG